jgi:hypothetical protein
MKKLLKVLVMATFGLFTIMACSPESGNKTSGSAVGKVANSTNAQVQGQNQQSSPEETIGDYVEQLQPYLDAKLLDMVQDLENPEEAPLLAISFQVVLNVDNNAVGIYNFEETSIFPMGGMNAYSGGGATYTVDCDLGDNSWSKSCDGKWSCGKLIYDCLQAGGCATICEAPMTTVDNSIPFFDVGPLEFLPPVEEVVTSDNIKSTVVTYVNPALFQSAP